MEGMSVRWNMELAPMPLRPVFVSSSFFRDDLNTVKASQSSSVNGASLLINSAPAPAQCNRSSTVAQQNREIAHCVCPPVTQSCALSHWQRDTRPQVTHKGVCSHIPVFISMP